MPDASSLLQGSALSFALLSIGHTFSGSKWTSEKVFKNIKNSQPWACATVGWYQGSAFLFTAGILHYQWSRDPSLLQDPLNKAIAGIVNILLWVSSAWYAKYGVKDNCVAVGLSAALQAFAVWKAL